MNKSEYSQRLRETESNYAESKHTAYLGNHVCERRAET